MTQAQAQALLAQMNAEEGQQLGPRIDAGAAADYRTKVFGVDTTTGIGYGGVDYSDKIKEPTLAALDATNASTYGGKGLLLLNGVPVDAATARALPLPQFRTLTIGFDPAYKSQIEALANPGSKQAPQIIPPVAAAPLDTQSNTIIPPRTLTEPAEPIARVAPSLIQQQTLAAPDLQQTAAATNLQQKLVPPTANQMGPANPPTGVRPQTFPDPRRAASPPQRQETAAPTSPILLGKITPQTTVLDLIVNGIQTTNNPEAAGLKAAATERLKQELKTSKPELADNPQAMDAAIQQGLPNAVRSLVVELSKDKAVQQKIATGFLDAMRRENPSAEQSGFYQNLKRLSSNEQTFPQFLNTNMLEGITRDFEQRARAENGGRVPTTIMDAVANNIMRVKPEIKQYNDRVGQSINDFVCNPEISRQRLLHSASTQREIREGVARFRREHPFQTFFADLIGTNMHAEGEKRALEEMAKRGMRDKNYSREIQTGFINELNRRTASEMRGEQLENMRAFTRHLSQLPYSRFIQEDISPRRMSAIILGIERPGEGTAPTRHLIPQQLISRNQSPHVNVAAAQTPPDPAAPRQQQPPRLTIHHVG